MFGALRRTSFSELSSIFESIRVRRAPCIVRMEQRGVQMKIGWKFLIVTSHVQTLLETPPEFA